MYTKNTIRTPMLMRYTPFYHTKTPRDRATIYLLPPEQPAAPLFLVQPMRPGLHERPGTVINERPQHPEKLVCKSDNILEMEEYCVYTDHNNDKVRYLAHFRTGFVQQKPRHKATYEYAKHLPAPAFLRDITNSV